MSILSFLLGANSLVSGVSQQLSNGASQLGTLNAPRLPSYLGGDSNAPSPYPNNSGQDPYNNAPDTGVVRKYEWEISRGCLAPDGFLKCGIFINGGYPGPLLEANWGDTFQVTIHNNITGPEEGTSLHWHGLNQKGTPWFDGVPGASQCPIAPGSSFTYTFKADQYGSSWYHAHFSAQYTDGVFGPIVIYGPIHEQYDIDIGPVLLNDYYHTPYYQNVQASIGKRFTPSSDNNFINGKMPFDCSQAGGQQCTPNAGVSKFRFRSGAKHRLRLINSGAEGLQKFTIDGHKITIIANDFVEVKPYQVDVVTLAVGQRADIIVEGTGNPGDSFWMRSDISKFCSFTNQPHALAAIYYEDADTSSTPQSTATPYQDNNCANDALQLTEPLFQRAPPSQPSITTHIDMEFQPNATGQMVWMMNNQSFRADYNQPILLLANAGNTSYPDQPEWNVYNYGNAVSVRLILTSIAPLHHPMHLHGHNFWVLAEGYGEWDGTIVRPENPQYRDTHQMERGDPTKGPAGQSYIVIEWLADNPGVWPMHCHIAWHLSSGMYINVMEHPDEIQNNMQVPDVMAQTCRDWWQFSGSNVVDQIDSGV
ncbi:multicopper oxidase [Zasmidium cellare ATCC 36951]|uniref:Multicopper oxidase n=1 Tax=Zasmidium cellare ATCC 36951 TaxID=1080233 RepID=A0A6A6CM49_ZASCE|nr:multicopper oxidase [Zasmidium cellare ATCC 36951]KAF2167002.1 multicopper oxidase [Zasmidium cellare ATCC 36951]